MAEKIQKVPAPQGLEEPAPAPPPHPSAAIVDAWFVETFHNIGLDALSINRFREAVLRLKARLAVKE